MVITIEFNGINLNEQAIVEAIKNDDVADLTLNMNEIVEEELILAVIRTVYHLYSQFDSQIQGFVDLNSRAIEIAFTEVIGPEVTPEDVESFFIEIKPE